MNSLLQDIRYGLRMLVKTPAFTAIAVLTLALGIGVNTAIFSLLNQVLLRVLPVPSPDELVVLYSPGDKRGNTQSDTDDGGEAFSYPLYKDLRDHNQVFSNLLARFPVSLNVSYQGQTDRAEGELVSGNYFETLGVRAALGRTLTADDDVTPGAHPLAVLSHRFWTRHFGGDVEVLNQTMTINGQAMTIIGVTQPGFAGVQVGQTPDIFIPITMKAQMTPNWDGLSNRQDYWLNILGRVAPGVSREQAQEGVKPLYRSLLESQATEEGSEEARAAFINRPLILQDGAAGRQILQSETRAPLLILMGMVGLVLLITCANLANLLLARGLARQKEIAVRLALGASRWRLVRQLLVESLVLALAGGTLSLLIAGWALAGLLQWLPEGQGFNGISTEFDWRLIGFTFGLSLLTGVIFGLIPAIKATRADLTTALKDQGKNSSAGVAHAALRKGLVIVEVALTVVLLVAAGLFARSLYNLKSVDIGIQTDRLMAFSIAPGLSGYTAERSRALYGELQESLAALPGVETVAGAEIAVMANSSMGSNFSVEGYTPSPGEEMQTLRNHITPDYFATMGITLVEGREFTAQDTGKSPAVAIISESLAARYWSGASPIGRRMKFGAGNSPFNLEIVGVVKNNRHASVRAPLRDFVYIPYTQRSAVGRMTFYVRTTQQPEAMALALRQQVARHDAHLPVYALRTLGEQIDEVTFNDRSVTMLSSAFGLLAALLAVVGIYGVMSYTVAQRTQEIGIRMALGAQAGNVLMMILKQGMALALVGIGLGLPVAFALTRLMKSLLYEVNTGDLLTFAAVAALLTTVALIACFIPARRATKVDPMIALRYE